jgi:hypothetical protein
MHRLTSGLCGAGLLVLAACTSTNRDSVRSTSRDWSKDSYATNGAPGASAPAATDAPAPTSPAAVRLSAARVLDKPEEPANPAFVLQVGSASTVLYSEPDVYSKPLARLGYGAAVLVQARAHFVRVPSHARMREASPASEETSPTWMKVQVDNMTGWVSARSLSRPLFVAHASDTKPGGTPVLPEAASGAASADALCALAAKPARFDFTAATVFTPAGRMDALRSIDRPLEKLDADLAKEMATERTDDAAVPGPWEPREPERSIAGGIHRIIRSTDDGKLNEATKDELELLTKDEPITSVEERFLARECMAALIGGAHVLPPEDPISCYVTWVGNRVAAQGSLPFPALGTLFVVIDSDAVNAVAVPGGPVIVTVGMLRFLENEHELACLLAHEAAHVEERHSLDSVMARGKGRKLNSALRLRAMISAGKLDETLATVYSSLPEDLRAPAIERTRPELTAFAQETVEACVRDALRMATEPEQGDEAAADLRGMSLARAGGWSPDALDAVLDRLARTETAYGGDRFHAERRAHAAEARTALPAIAPPGKPGDRWRKLDDLLAARQGLVNGGTMGSKPSASAKPAPVSAPPAPH